MTSRVVTGVVPGAESDLHDEPHIEGSRVTVLYVQRQVEERGVSPAEFADGHDLDVADVYAALTYYYANPDEMRAVEQRRADLVEEADAMTTLSPPDE